MWARSFYPLALAAVLSAQQAPIQPGQLPKSAQTQPSSGITAEWDVRANMEQLSSAIEQFGPVLRRLRPEEWIAKGASGSYVQQVRSSREMMTALTDATAKLAREPERLTAALDAYFLMERMELLLGSLKDGIRRYQSGTTADDLNVALGEASNHRDKLRQHIQDLAAAREQDFKVADSEAQRCREMISRQQPAEPSKPEPRRIRKRD